MVPYKIRTKFWNSNGTKRNEVPKGTDKSENISRLILASEVFAATRTRLRDNFDEFLLISLHNFVLYEIFFFRTTNILKYHI